jgi:hypothetical protein
MSKIRAMSRGGYIVVGFVVAMLLVPTAAFASGTLTFNGIQGISGRQADVTTANQLKTSVASPSDFYQSGDVSVALEAAWAPIVTPPAAHALIVTVIHIEGEGQQVSLEVQQGSCTGSSGPGNGVGAYYQRINSPDDQTMDVPMSPGLAIPSGDTLCGESTAANVGVSGYLVPSYSVPTS